MKITIITYTRIFKEFRSKEQNLQPYLLQSLTAFLTPSLKLTFYLFFRLNDRKGRSIISCSHLVAERSILRAWKSKGLVTPAMEHNGQMRCKRWVHIFRKKVIHHVVIWSCSSCCSVFNRLHDFRSYLTINTT